MSTWSRQPFHPSTAINAHLLSKVRFYLHQYLSALINISLSITKNPDARIAITADISWTSVLGEVSLNFCALVVVELQLACCCARMTIPCLQVTKFVSG